MLGVNGVFDIFLRRAVGAVGAVGIAVGIVAGIGVEPKLATAVESQFGRPAGRSAGIAVDTVVAEVLDKIAGILAGIRVDIAVAAEQVEGTRIVAVEVGVAGRNMKAARPGYRSRMVAVVVGSRKTVGVHEQCHLSEAYGQKNELTYRVV